MRKSSDYLDVVDATFSHAARSGAIYNTIEDQAVDGRIIHLQGKRLIHFGSCGYTGMELAPEIKAGIIEATQRYGAQFPSSRVYVQTPLYEECESLLEEIFGGPTLLTASTTFAHLTALPVFIKEEDVIILDQQVHHTVQQAANIVRLQGTHVEMIRHNRMDLLEERINALRGKARQIWYLADGVYSMFGDLAPLDELSSLLDRYEQFHLYLDDAHGVSCFGQHGRGYVLDRMPIRSRMMVAISLCKGFGGAGGGLVFPNAELKRRARICGGPMTFSGPIQPPMLGATLASARLHLSPEFSRRQQALALRMETCNHLLEKHGLPVVDPSIAPIRYIGLGLPRVVFNMVNRLMKEGYYVNTGIFPAVPMKRGGVRFTLTTYQTLEDLDGLVQAMAHHFPYVIDEEGTSREEIKVSFRRALPQSFLEKTLPQKAVSHGELSLQVTETIEALDPAEWDRLLGDRGTFTWEGLRFLEATFRENPEPENNWSFRYFVVRESDGKPILATFFTNALWKDDMISPEKASFLIEEKRKSDPYFLTSQTLSMGSLLTEGDHLFLDRDANWRGAMRLLLKAIEDERLQMGASKIAIRDLSSEDPEMEQFLLEQGFVRFEMPETMVLDLDWKDEAEYLGRMSQKGRHFLRHEVFPWRSAFEYEILRDPDEALLEECYRLYQSVQTRGLLINSFPLPRDIFHHALAHKGWELTIARLKPEMGGPVDGRPIACLLSYHDATQFVPFVIGLDYDFVYSHRSYRCFLDYAVRRAHELGKERLFFGFGASLEKKRFGAKAHRKALYALAIEGYNMDLLAQIMVDAAGPSIHLPKKQGRVVTSK